MFVGALHILKREAEREGDVQQLLRLFQAVHLIKALDSNLSCFTRSHVEVEA